MKSSTCCAPRLAGSDGAVHSRRAAADHRHAACKVVGLRLGEKVSHLNSQRFVLDAELDGFPKTDGHADRVVSLGEQTLGIRDVRICGGVDRTQGEGELDISLHGLLVKPMVRDEVQHAAELLASFEDVHGVTKLGESGSRAQGRQGLRRRPQLFFH